MPRPIAFSKCLENLFEDLDLVALPAELDGPHERREMLHVEIRCAPPVRVPEHVQHVRPIHQESVAEQHR